jgi:signal transduction histidine kinase
MLRRHRRFTAGYALVLLGAFVLAIAASWMPLSDHVDDIAYDWMFLRQPPKPWPPSSIILGIDETTFEKMDGQSHLRQIIARGLELIEKAGPKAVAVDVILADDPKNPENAALEAAFAKTPNLVLSSDRIASIDRWEDPLPLFSRHAAALGHAHRLTNSVCRSIQLRQIAGRVRRWALALEAFRLARGAQYIEESPDSLQVGSTLIPVTTSEALLYIRYLPPLPDGASRIPEISVAQLAADPSLAERFRGKVVFAGVTAMSAAQDRPMTPYDTQSGVVIHAQAYETMAHGQFLIPVSNKSVIGICMLMAVLAGFIFVFTSGVQGYVFGGLLIFAAHLTPHIAFSAGIVFPYTAPVLTAWFCVSAAASYMHFFVRRQLRDAERDKARYLEAIHMVSHEMRSPLTAIQGTSELMGRYTLSDDKRKQMAQMINSESKRLARMIQTFLDVERLSAGEMDLRTDSFAAQDAMEACLQRARPLADRKEIQLRAAQIDPWPLKGDRELMEYAIYNLLTNAVKYSPPNTTVTIAAHAQGSMLHLSVADQGIGMEPAELKNIFKKFYRTKKAETSGEVGTGIGLSIVEQIVTHHGGRIDVTSTPGKGSCFTIVLPRGTAPETAPASKMVSH